MATTKVDAKTKTKTRHKTDNTGLDIKTELAAAHKKTKKNIFIIII